MCLRTGAMSTPRKKQQETQTTSPRLRGSPRTSPGRRRQHRELPRPRLSRRIVSSARVNLNSYWSKFEELSKQGSQLITFEMPNSGDILRSSIYSSYHDNEINENLINEMMEQLSRE